MSESLLPDFLEVVRPPVDVEGWGSSPASELAELVLELLDPDGVPDDDDDDRLLSDELEILLSLDRPRPSSGSGSSVFCFWDVLATGLFFFFPPFFLVSGSILPRFAGEGEGDGVDGVEGVPPASWSDSSSPDLAMTQKFEQKDLEQLTIVARQKDRHTSKKVAQEVRVKSLPLSLSPTAQRKQHKQRKQCKQSKRAKQGKRTSQRPTKPRNEAMQHTHSPPLQHKN